GVFHWTSPAGYQYLVTPDGTTRIQVPEEGAGAEAGPEVRAGAEAAETKADTEPDPAETETQLTEETEPPVQAELPDEPERLDEAS
ncbi:MAG: hypothetical protein WBL05_06965, partial [Brooklawnia sp.]|uniref:hypothetical protein n=1 Tax=Brooklawnia sp. TaxID=2699740 RepID=UPI003C745DFF